MVQLYIEALNTPGAVPNVQSAWETFVGKKCFDAKQTALVTYEGILTSAALPCDDDKICAVHDAAYKTCQEHFLADVEGISEDTVKLHLTDLKVSAWKTVIRNTRVLGIPIERHTSFCALRLIQ